MGDYKDFMSVSRGSTKVKTASTRLFLVSGNDEYSIKEHALELSGKLTPAGGGEFAVEVVEGEGSNQEVALKELDRLSEALTQVGLFGSEKLVWWKSTLLLADNITTRTEAVKERLGELLDDLKRGLPSGVTLLISAVGLDKRRALYKFLEKSGEVKLFELPDIEKAAGSAAVDAFVVKRARDLGKKMSDRTLQVFRDLVSADFREIASELEKAALYVGDREQITEADVRAICSPTRQAVVWDLTDAVCNRQLTVSVKAIENLLGFGESAIGAVILLAGQFRLLLLAQDLEKRGLIRPGLDSFAWARAFGALPEEAVAHFPRNKDGSLPNPWRLGRVAQYAPRFTRDEIARALALLFEANLKMVSTQLDERLVLEEAITRIVAQKTKEPVTTG